MSGVGYNVHPFRNQDESERLVRHVKAMRTPPGIMVVMDDPHFARRLKKELPRTRIIYRKYFPSDNQGDDNAQEKISPQQWLNVYAADIHPSEGIYYYANNEPGTQQKTWDWLTEVARLTRDAGGRVVLGNFSVGVPEPLDWQRGQALLRMCATAPERLLLGLHEYGPTLWTVGIAGNNPNPSSWPVFSVDPGAFMGRFRNLLQYCQALNIPAPLIAITEWGWDRIHAVHEWQQSLRRAAGCDIVGPLWCNVPQWIEWAGQDWPAYAFSQLKAAHEAIYRPHPQIVGKALFCHSAMSGSAWEGFDFGDMPPSFFRSVETADWSQAMSSNPIVPGNKPEQRKAQLGAGLSHVNVRVDPSTSAADIGDVYHNDIFTVYMDSSATANGYNWKRVVTPVSNKVGWVASVPGLMWIPITQTPPLDPADVARKALESARDIIEKGLADLDAL